MDLTTARAYLQRREPAATAAAGAPGAPANGGGGSCSVYDHLTDVVVALLNEQPGGALEAFEAVSARVKAAGAGVAGALVAAAGGGAGAAATTTTADVAGAHASAAGDDALRARRLGALAALTAVGALPAAEGEAAPAVSGEPDQDVLGDAALLEWGGLSVGSRADAYRLGLALKALAASHPGLAGVRWWGTLHGTRSGDYVVAEGTYADPADYPGGGAAFNGDGATPARDATGHAVQAPGAPGPNERAYFVCAAPGEPWVPLPPVTPHQVAAARRLRRFLTGDLAAPVGGHPPFPGGEVALLRATIALITAETAVAPAGAFTSADDGGACGIVPAPPDEWAPPADLADPASWVHTALALNAIGRTEPDPPLVDAATGEEAPPAADAPESSTPLRPLTDDAWPPAGASAGGGGSTGDYALLAESGGAGGAWHIRTLPPVSSMTSAGVSDPHAVVVLRSLRWPGAVAVGRGKRYACAYVGYGLPALPAGGDGRSPFQPALPPPPPAEFDYSGATPGQRVAEQPDVAADPDAGRAGAGGEGGDEEGGAEA